MKKLVTFRLEPALLEKMRLKAEAENRTLTNFVETVLKRAVERSAAGADKPPAMRVSDTQPH